MSLKFNIAPPKKKHFVLAQKNVLMNYLVSIDNCASKCSCCQSYYPLPHIQQGVLCDSITNIYQVEIIFNLGLTSIASFLHPLNNGSLYQCGKEAIQSPTNCTQRLNENCKYELRLCLPSLPHIKISQPTQLLFSPQKIHRYLG